MVEVLFAVVIGVLYASATYLILRRSMVKLVLGLALMANAANLLILTAGGLRGSRPPLVPPGADVPLTGHADPLPQALILTAIVIGFGVLAFALALLYKGYEQTQDDDLNDLRTTDH